MLIGDDSDEDGENIIQPARQLSSEPADSFNSSSANQDVWPEVKTNDLQWLEQIGTGHTSEVFRGQYLCEQVAIKQFVMSKGKVDDEMLAREVAIMCLVRHPHIVRLHGVVISEMAPPHIIMEYCAGGSCFDLIHRNSGKNLPTWSQLLKMCMHVAIAMDYLHKFNPCIIHRDLKSLNILLDQPVKDARDVPVAKVADFGLARVLETGEDTAMTLGVGTGRWMAPEMLSRAVKYNEKVDVYSFAMLLYEITCKQIPFENDHPMEMRRQVLSGRRPDLSSLASEAPANMRDLINQCWAGNPKKRPSFEEIIAVIRGAGFQVVMFSL